MYAASTQCSPGATSLSTNAWWISAVHIASWTAAVVVWTCVSRCGVVGSQVSLTWTVEPTQDVVRLWWERASGSYGDWLSSAGRGHSSFVLNRTRGAVGCPALVVCAVRRS